MSKKIERLTVSAVLIALATVLSFVKVYQLPLGGAITLLSMLPIVVISVRYGTPWGLVSAFCYALVQLGTGIAELMSWGMTPVQWVGSVVFDYLLPFTAIGLAGILVRKGAAGIVGGTAAALAIRFISHFISGTIFFAQWCPEGWNVVWYSVCYNGSYMLPELIFTVVAVGIISALPQGKRLMNLA